MSVSIADLTRSAKQFVAFALLAAATIAAIAFGPPLSGAAGAQEPGAGLYEQHCASCHQPDGAGIAGTFPPLAGNPAAADVDYVSSAITDGVTGPIDVLGVAYDSTMPPFADIASDDVALLAAYVAELSGADPVGEPATVVAGATNGNPARGRDLFEGATRFDQGGAACVACHTAGEVGNLGGRGLGPDLTYTYSDLGGEAGLTGWLTNPPSPTMKPIFDDRPLTDDELADVVAFLAESATGDTTPGGIDRLSIAGLVGLLLLVGGMAAAWRGMRRTYKSRLRSKR